MRLQRSTWFTLLVVLASLGLAVTLRGSAETAAPPQEGAVRAPVRVAVLRRESLAGETVAGGFLRALHDVTISAERSGRVVALPVAEGASVRAGDPVAHLDDTAAAAGLAQARAAAREAALDPNLPAAELVRLREALTRAEYEHGLHHPVSPLAGVVEVHHVDAGEFVAPGTPLVDVLDASVLILDVDVDAEVVVGLRPGQEVAVRVPAAGRKGDRVGAISRLAARADPATRRFRVEVAFEAGGDSLRPGMYAEARFVLPPGPAGFYVPKAAVRLAGGERVVFLVEDGRARRRAVGVEGVHLRPDLWRVVEGDLREGGELIVAGFSGLRDGGAVEVLR